MGFIPAEPPPKSKTIPLSDDNLILMDGNESLIDVVENNPSAFCNRMDFDNISTIDDDMV
jgi:hypothetical protein